MSYEEIERVARAIAPRVMREFGDWPPEEPFSYYHLNAVQQDALDAIAAEAIRAIEGDCDG